MHPKKIESVLKMNGDDRFNYFVRKVADFETAWGLKRGEQRASAYDDAGTPALPLWPEEPFAALCAKDEWRDFAPAPIGADEVLNGPLSDSGLAAVFPTPNDKAVFVAREVLADAIRQVRAIRVTLAYDSAHERSSS